MAVARDRCELTCEKLPLAAPLLEANSTTAADQSKMQAPQPPRGDRLLLARGGTHPALLATIRNACRDDWKLCILVNVDAAQLEEKLLAAGVPRYRLPRSLTYQA